MSFKETIPLRLQELDTLRKSITECLNEDKRLTAAWITAPAGATERAIAGIEVWIAVADNYRRFVLDRCGELSARFGTVLCACNSDRNPTVEELSIQALYSGNSGPHRIEWHWVRPGITPPTGGSEVLFDRSESSPVTSGQKSPADGAKHKREIRETLARYWTAVHVAVSFAVEGKPWDAISAVIIARDAEKYICEISDRSGNIGDTVDLDALPASPQDQVRWLKASVRRLLAMTRGIDGEVKTEVDADASEISQFLDLSEVILAELRHGQAG